MGERERGREGRLEGRRKVGVEVELGLGLELNLEVEVKLEQSTSCGAQIARLEGVCVAAFWSLHHIHPLKLCGFCGFCSPHNTRLFRNLLSRSNQM